MAIDQALLTTLSDDESKSIKRLVDKGIKLPLQPHVLEEMRHLLSRGVTDLRVIARSISQDAGIVAALFRVVQSAAYRRMQPFESVEQILQAIGTRQTFNIVQAVALAAAMPSKHNAQAFGAFWARSQAVAQIAMLIAEDRVSVCNIFPDQAYLAGIFHDCGVPVLMQRFSTYCKAMHADEQGAWLDLAEEDKRFNADHCVVGYLVGKHWKLPDFICDAIRFHHDMAGLGNHAARTMVGILQLAIHLYYLDLHIENPEWPRVEAAVADELGLRSDALPEFIDDIFERYHSEQR
ncbi:MAG: HDOD domain-containing protein [Rhodocyclales bacterium]|nr:HDOD domain-containing protein [Rhodocyclales bacterium]